MFISPSVWKCVGFDHSPNPKFWPKLQTTHGLSNHPQMVLMALGLRGLTTHWVYWWVYKSHCDYIIIGLLAWFTSLRCSNVAAESSWIIKLNGGCSSHGNGFPICWARGFPSCKLVDSRRPTIPCHLLHAVTGFVHAVRHSPSVVTGRGCLLVFFSFGWRLLSWKIVAFYYLFRLCHLSIMWLGSS